MNFEKKEIIGMIHLSGPDTLAKAMDEIKIYEEEGLSAIIIENYHGGMLDVTNVLDALVENPTTMSVGINILPNEYKVAYELCDKYDFIDFIQMDYIAGKYNTSIQLDIENFYKEASTRLDIRILGGVWPKYYTPVEGSILANDIEEGLFLCDAIVVTGEGTGSETPFEKIQLFRDTMDGIEDEMIDGKTYPLIVGAGVSPLNVAQQLEYAQGAIVGSAFKPLGKTRQMVDRDLVKVFMIEVNKLNAHEQEKDTGEIQN